MREEPQIMWFSSRTPEVRQLQLEAMLFYNPWIFLPLPYLVQPFNSLLMHELLGCLLGQLSVFELLTQLAEQHQSPSQPVATSPNLRPRSSKILNLDDLMFWLMDNVAKHFSGLQAMFPEHKLYNCLLKLK